LRRLPLIVAITLAGCHATDTVPAPDLSGAASALLFSVTDGEIGFVHAIAADDPTYPAFARRGDGDLYLLRYACGLSALDLEPGEQALRDAPRASLDIPEPTDALGLELGGALEWAPVESVPAPIGDALLRLDVRERNLCQQAVATVEAEDVQYTVPDTEDLVFGTAAVPVGDAVLISALFAGDLARTSTSGHSAYRLDDAGLEVWPEVRDLGPVLAALPLADGDLWLMGAEHLWRGHPDRGFEVVTSTTFDPLPRRVVLAGPPDGSRLYLAASADLEGIAGQFSSRRWLYELGPQGWRRLEQLDIEDGMTSSVDLAWIEPGLVVGVGLSPLDGEATIIEGDALTREPAGERLSHAQRLEGVGAVVAGADGRVRARQGGAWVTLREPAAPHFVRQVFDLGAGGRGYLGIGQGLELGQQLPELGDCGSTRIAGSLPRRVVQTGPRRFVALMTAIRGAQLRVAQVELTDGPFAICQP